MVKTVNVFFTTHTHTHTHTKPKVKFRATESRMVVARGYEEGTWGVII